VLSAERIVLLPARGRRRSLVLDLFTGRETVVFHLDTPAAASTSEDAWIQDDLLIVPWFLGAHDPASNHVVAYDLASGARAWRVALGEDRPAVAPETRAQAQPDSPAGGDASAAATEGGAREPDARELAGILQCGDRAWILVRPSAGPADKTSAPAIFELAPRIGALSPLPGVRIALTDRVVGLSQPRRLAIQRNLLLLLGSRDGSAEARLRAVDLDHGEQWTQPLQVSFNFLDQGRLQPPLTTVPAPALSADSIAIAYSVLAGQGISSTHVESFDAASGRSLGTVKLSREMGQSSQIRFHPLGDGLLVRGPSGLMVLR
jgi:hypothetical protein